MVLITFEINEVCDTDSIKKSILLSLMKFSMLPRLLYALTMIFGSALSVVTMKVALGNNSPTAPSTQDTTRKGLDQLAA